MDHETTHVQNNIAEWSDVVRIDIPSLNGKVFVHTVKELWVSLNHKPEEVIGQSSSKISSKVLRVNIQLSMEISLKEVSDFLFEKSTGFQNYSY